MIEFHEKLPFLYTGPGLTDQKHGRRAGRFSTLRDLTWWSSRLKLDGHVSNWTVQKTKQWRFEKVDGQKSKNWTVHFEVNDRFDQSHSV